VQRAAPPKPKPRPKKRAPADEVIDLADDELHE
jgi:hypothetical protein